MKYKKRIGIVPRETSDIFFHFGCRNYTQAKITRMPLEHKLEWLKKDAEQFLEIVNRPNLTPQDLVDDFLNRE
jgi:hypothetical protein